MTHNTWASPNNVVVSIKVKLARVSRKKSSTVIALLRDGG